MSFKGQSIFTTTKSSGFVFFAHIKQDNEANWRSSLAIKFNARSVAKKISIGRQPYFAYGHQIFEFSWYLFMFFVACLKLGHHLCVLYFVRIHVYVRLHHHISCPRIFRSIGKDRYIPPTFQHGRFIISSQVHSDIVPLIQIESTYCDHTRYK